MLSQIKMLCNLRPEDEGYGSIYLLPSLNCVFALDTVIVEKTHQSKGEHKGKIEGKLSRLRSISVLNPNECIVKLDISDLLFQMINQSRKIFSFLKDKV